MHFSLTLSAQALRKLNKKERKNERRKKKAPITLLIASGAVRKLQK